MIGTSDSTSTEARRRPDGPAGMWLLMSLVAYTLFFYRDLIFAQRVVVFGGEYAISLAIGHVSSLLAPSDWPPLWTPFAGFGKPLVDPLNALFYPANWLLRPLPWPLGSNLSVVLHHLWAAIGMFLLLRRGTAWAAAAFGAVLFSFGGAMVSLDHQVTALQSAAWAPWALLGFDTWCERASFAPLALTAIALAMSLLGGMPEVFLFENGLIAALVIDHRVSRGSPYLPRAAAAGVLANMLAIAIAAVQVVPAAELWLHSSHSAGFDPDAILRLALRPFGVFAFLLPRHYIDPSGRFNEVAALWEGDFSDAPWALTLYLGPALALAAGASLSRFQRRWWIGIGLAFVCLACGPRVPGYGAIVQRVPWLHILRAPEELILVAHGLLAVAAAIGLDNALRDQRNFRTVRRTALVLGAIALLAAGVVALRPSFARDLLSRDLLVIAASLGLLAVIATAGMRRAQAAACAVLALTALDLYRVNARFLPTLEAAEVLREPDSTRAMRRDDGPLRIYSDAIGRPAVPSFPDRFVQDRNLLLNEASSHFDLANLNAPSALPLRDHQRFAALIEEVQREQVAPLFAAFNIAYVTSAKDLERYPGLTPVLKPSTPSDAYVYAVDNVTARAYVPQHVDAVEDDGAAIASVLRSRAPASRVALRVADVPPGLPETMAGTVRVESYRPHDVELAASMDTDGIVVLSDAFYPGWDATLDGAPVPIMRGNYFARAVFVPAGEHRVQFRYRPRSFRLGAAISVAACAVLLIGLLLARRR